MNTVIGVGVFLVIAVICVIVVWRATRKPGDESPKRRELKTAKLRAVNAQRAMNDLEIIFARYRSWFSDEPTAQAFVDEVNSRITQYKSETLELDK